MVAGEYVSSKAAVQDATVCCERGQNTATNADEAGVLVGACPTIVKYTCENDACTKVISTATPNGEGAMTDSQPEATADDEKEAIC